MVIRFRQGGKERGITINPPSDPSPNSSIQLSVLLRTLAWPLTLWGIIVAALLVARQPGVVCITPMAWLLSLVCGRQYIFLSGGRRGRSPLLGPALSGAVLGLCMSILFIVVSTVDMAPGSAPGEAGKAILLDAVLGVAGILVCAALSAFMGWLTLNRYYPATQ